MATPSPFPSFPVSRSRARCQLAGIAFERDRDVERSARELRRGLLSAPADEVCLNQAARLLDAAGESERSIGIQEHLQRRDPVNPVAFINLGYSLYLSGRHDDALAALEKARTLNPDTGAMHSLVALTYALRGEPGDLERALATARLKPIDGFRLEVEAILHHMGADRAASDAALDALVETHGEGWAYNIAVVFAARDEPDRAFEWLERAVENGDSGLSSARVDPLFESLRGDSRWPRFLEQVGLADSQLADLDLDVELP